MYHTWGLRRFLRSVGVVKGQIFIIKINLYDYGISIIGVENQQKFDL